MNRIVTDIEYHKGFTNPQKEFPTGHLYYGAVIENFDDYLPIDYKSKSGLEFASCGEWELTSNDEICELLVNQVKTLSKEIQEVTKHLKNTLDKLDKLDFGR